ncbi:MAG: (2Fe-2S) ferredoxin domain-containing protein, partial [Bacilli bacterium]|nr:(2Fe-2S) ferredoxin domain-containing protein [Bacilli bacterium]
MERITSAEILDKEIASCTRTFDAKIKGEGGKRAVCVCGGTGCIANNSVAIEEELEKLIKEYKLEDKVTVNHVGCFGFCSQGPFVKIFPEDTLYRAVKVADVRKIVEN